MSLSEGMETVFGFVRKPGFWHLAIPVLMPTFVAGAAVGSAVSDFSRGGWGLVAAAAICLLIVGIALSEAKWD